MDGAAATDLTLLLDGEAAEAGAVVGAKKVVGAGGAGYSNYIIRAADAGTAAAWAEALQSRVALLMSGGGAGSGGAAGGVPSAPPPPLPPHAHTATGGDAVAAVAEAQVRCG